MTGPEHYREAERALQNAYRAEKRGLEPIFLQYAQAHAALALAAATAAGSDQALWPAEG